MKGKTQKGIRVCAIIALVICIVWAMYSIAYFISLLSGIVSFGETVDWTRNSMVKAIYYVGYLAATIWVIGLCVKLVLNTFKGIRENTVFPQNNVKPLFWLAFAFFLYLLCWSNTPILYEDDFVFRIMHTNFITPFFLLFFAFMYKVAADAVEENNLTV